MLPTFRTKYLDFHIFPAINIYHNANLLERVCRIQNVYIANIGV